MAPERPSRAEGPGLPDLRDSAPEAAMSDFAPSRAEVRRRISSLYDRAETVTGNYNATRAMSKGGRTRAGSAPGRSGPAADPSLESITRQWFDAARAQVGPTVPAVLPADRLPNPAGSRRTTPSRRPVDGPGGLARELTARSLPELPPGPSATTATVPDLPAGPTAARRPATGPVAELTAGPSGESNAGTAGQLPPGVGGGLTAGFVGESTVGTGGRPPSGLVDDPTPGATDGLAAGPAGGPSAGSAGPLSGPGAGPAGGETAGTLGAFSTAPVGGLSAGLDGGQRTGSVGDLTSAPMGGLGAEPLGGLGAGPAAGLTAGPVGGPSAGPVSDLNTAPTSGLGVEPLGWLTAGPADGPSAGSVSDLTMASTDGFGTGLVGGLPTGPTDGFGTGPLGGLSSGPVGGPAAGPGAGVAEGLGGMPGGVPFGRPAAGPLSGTAVGPSGASAPAGDLTAVPATGSPAAPAPFTASPDAAPHPWSGAADAVDTMGALGRSPASVARPGQRAMRSSKDRLRRQLAHTQEMLSGRSAARGAVVPAGVEAPGTLPADAPGPASDRRADRALAFARAQIGKPCVWGATGPDSYDGAGLTQAAWRVAGVVLPRTAAEQSGSGTPISLTDLQPGDLVFFYAEVSHVGLYAGNGTMVHAPTPGAPLREESVFFAGAQAIHSAVRPA
ncbi:NlpC/P60 family protein [Streptomyces sp. NPDC086766]|uniref:NlpC/P60 family protein n=1 Tax=Streptomyces sp. NPDC086766 TaxID=3365754 RepID=UPI00381298F4